MPSCSGTLGQKQPRAPFAGAHESVWGFAQTLASSYLVATLRVSQRGTESNSIPLRKARSENYFGAKYRKQVFSSHPSLFMPMPRGSRCFPNGALSALQVGLLCRPLWALYPRGVGSGQEDGDTRERAPCSCSVLKQWAQGCHVFSPSATRFSSFSIFKRFLKCLG